MILFAVLLGIIASWLLIDKKTAITNAVLKGTLAFCFTLSILSFFFVLFLFAKINFLIFNAAFVLAPLIYIVIEIRKSGKRAFASIKITQISTLFLLVALAGLLLFSKTFFENSIRWGDWDAWAIWSQHGLFLTDSSLFANLFTQDIAWTHPDYPLMLPSLNAMFWKSFGSQSAFVPAVLGYSIAMALVLLILSSFFERKFVFSGLFVFLLLTATSVLFPFAATQQADTFLALFLLIPIVLCNHLEANKSALLVTLIGFFAATSAWIKNEGLVFFVLFAFCFSVKYFRQAFLLRNFFLGAIFPIVVLMVFKFNYAPPGDLFANNDYHAKLFDAGRYKIIRDFARQYLTENCQFLLYIMGGILVLHYKFYLSFAFIVIFGLAASYFFIYVITPNDLNWHLSTSFYRLVHQLFPVLLYSIFFSASEKWPVILSVASKVKTKFSNLQKRYP
ncbi:MAG TPA: hypothetical protein VK528_11475 [Flavobacterium sp.]|nr:hypothetical protein [Flavobacterium sp.]